MIKIEPTTLVTLGKNIWMFVITGGPCSGKTTCLARLVHWLQDRGYKVVLSAESATKLILGGMSPGELSWSDFQCEILLDILAQEERMISIAKKYRDQGKKVVILCDRGTMDGEAYVGKAEYDEILSTLVLDRRQICDARYHAVMHLRTTALGAEKHYQLANNAARSETPEQARELDEKTLQAWLRHPHPRVIDNSTDLEGKIRRLMAEISAVLGDPEPLEIEEKYLVDPDFDPAALPVSSSRSSIVQTYLISPVPLETHRLRSRGDKGSETYFYTIKRPVKPGVRAEQERIISRGEYDALMEMRDRTKHQIAKERICFFWNSQFFELDRFSSPRAGLMLLEAERSNEQMEVELPPFIPIIRRVTDEQEFSNAEIARRLQTSSYGL